MCLSSHCWHLLISACLHVFICAVCITGFSLSLRANAAFCALTSNNNVADKKQCGLHVHCGGLHKSPNGFSWWAETNGNLWLLVIGENDTGSMKLHHVCSLVKWKLCLILKHNSVALTDFIIIRGAGNKHDTTPLIFRPGTCSDVQHSHTFYI